MFPLVSNLQIFHRVLVGRRGPHQSTQRLENQYFDMSHAISKISRCWDSGAARPKEPASLLCQRGCVIVLEGGRPHQSTQRLEKVTFDMSHDIAETCRCGDWRGVSLLEHFEHCAIERGGGGAPSFGRIYIFNYPRQQDTHSCV